MFMGPQMMQVTRKFTGAQVEWDMYQTQKPQYVFQDMQRDHMNLSITMNGGHIAGIEVSDALGWNHRYLGKW